MLSGLSHQLPDITLSALFYFRQKEGIDIYRQTVPTTI